MAVLHQPSSMLLWQDVIQEAKKVCALALKEEVESYLVFLMIRYTASPAVVKEIVATDFLHGLQSSPFVREYMLQTVADKCLLFSGLFPRLAGKRLVKISYYVNLGQSSYAQISKAHNDVYSLLAKQFVPLMDLLQSLRNANLLPLEAYELWNETGSRRAYEILQQYRIHKPYRQ